MMISSPKYFYIVLLALLLTASACGFTASPQADQQDGAASFAAPLSNQVEVHQDEEAADADHSHEHLAEADLTAEMKVVLVPSELVVGPNRFAVGLFDPSGKMIHDATVHLHYFDLSDPQQAVLEQETDAQRLQTPEGRTTIFAHERDFERAGDWGVEVEARLSDGTAARQRIGFQVLADSTTLSPGDKAPPLKTPTLADVAQDLSRLTSADAPNPNLYDQSLAEALVSGKPTLLLFATPAFCQTRFCGPAYEIVSDLQKRYADEVNFIHVEVFSGLPDPRASGWKVVPAVEAFGLQGEPWAYFIDEQGVIIYRVEGLFTAEEIERQIRAHLDL